MEKGLWQSQFQVCAAQAVEAGFRFHLGDAVEVMKALIFTSVSGKVTPSRDDQHPKTALSLGERV